MKAIHLIEDWCILRTQAGALCSNCILLTMHCRQLRLQCRGPCIQVRHLRIEQSGIFAVHRQAHTGVGAAEGPGRQHG
jgi:hypothetical protein